MPEGYTVKEAIVSGFFSGGTLYHSSCPTCHKQWGLSFRALQVEYLYGCFQCKAEWKVTLGYDSELQYQRLAKKVVKGGRSGTDSTNET